MIDTASDRERRLRELHGVLEMAVMIAGDALAEAHPELTGREWFEVLVKEAAKRAQDARVFEGRWSLFADEEIDWLYAVTADRAADPRGDRLAREIELEVEEKRGRIASLKGGRVMSSGPCESVPV